MLEQLKIFLAGQWNKFFPGSAIPKQMRFILTKGSMGAYGGKVTFFVFTDKNPNPELVIKINRDPKAKNLLATEYEALNYLNQNISERLKIRIPKVFSLEKLGEYEVLAQEAVSGMSVDRLVTSALFGRSQKASCLLNSVCDWLQDLKYEIYLKDNPRINPSNQKEYFYEPIDYFTKVFGLCAQENEFLAIVKEGLLEAAKQNLPLVFEHGDFSPINILVAKDDFRVIDWASAKFKGLALNDLFFLLTWFNFRNYASGSAGKARIRNFSEFYFNPGAHSNIACSLIKKCCQKFNIEMSFVKPLLALFIIEKANNEYDELLKQAERGYIPLIKPFDEGLHYKDQSLMKNGIYINIFRKLAFDHDKFII